MDVYAVCFSPTTLAAGPGARGVEWLVHRAISGLTIGPYNTNNLGYTWKITLTSLQLTFFILLTSTSLILFKSTSDFLNIHHQYLPCKDASIEDAH